MRETTRQLFEWQFCLKSIEGYIPYSKIRSFFFSKPSLDFQKDKCSLVQ